MKTIIHGKFEGGYLSDEGFGGSSYEVKVTLRHEPGPEPRKQIEKIIDLFDHTLLTHTEHLEQAIKFSLRTISVNGEFRESIYAQCIFNMTSLIVPEYYLVEVEVSNTKDTTYICENFEGTLVIDLENLKGE